VKRILGIQALFLPSLCEGVFAAAPPASTGAARPYLKNHCWATPTTLPVSQIIHQVRSMPSQKKKDTSEAMNCSIFCWLGSPAAGGRRHFLQCVTRHDHDERQEVDFEMFVLREVA